MDDIYDLIERSSLGTPAAKAIRARTPRWMVDQILARTRELDRERQQETSRATIDIMGWAELSMAMPLDTPGRVRAAWSMINRPIVARALAGELLLDADATATYTRAQDRIQLAAIEHGMGLLPEP